MRRGLVSLLTLTAAIAAGVAEGVAPGVAMAAPADVAVYQRKAVTKKAVTKKKASKKISKKITDRPIVVRQAAPAKVEPAYSAVVPGASVAKAEAESFPKFEGSLATEYYFAQRNDVMPFMAFTVDMFLHFNDRFRLRLIQAATKPFTVAVGQDEFQIDDTILYGYYRLNQDPLLQLNGNAKTGLNFTMRLGATAPFSQNSRGNSIITKPSVGLQLTYKVLDGKLAFGYLPNFRYYVNRFTTAQFGGAPLRRTSLGHTLSIKFNPDDKWELWTSASLASHTTETVTSGANPNASGTYQFEGYAAYGFTKNIGLRVGFDNSNDMIREGNYEISVIDPNNTRYYMALDLSL
jgi:hypothetical protein